MNGGRKPALARTFRRAALPLGWYYGVTLGLPFANGAAHAGTTFVTHALVVLVIPLLLIALAYAVQWSVYGLASALPLSRTSPSD